MWGYEGDFGDIHLSAQGIVTTTKSSDDKSIKDDADEDLQEDIDQVTFKSITADGDRRLLVGAREGGKLTITEGLYEKESSRKAAILNNGELVLGTYDRKVPQSSTYSGATVVMKDGHIQTLNADAIGPESPTLVRGRLSLGDETTGVIEQNFAKRLIVGKGGITENGALSVTSLTNAGDVQIDSLTVNNGMKRLLDVLAERGDLSEDSPLRKIKAQGSLKNLGGNFEIAGDLIYQDNKDATAGHALINTRNLRDVINYEKNERNGAVPQPGTLAASRIMMGSNNDVILNSGIISTTTRDEGKTSINLRGGNDLILNRGTFDIGESIIDGGEELVLERTKPVQGLNIFRQGFDPRSDSSDNSSGLEETQLVNFAAIKLDAGGDWIFPQGQDCQVRGKSKNFNNDTRCVGITGLKKEDQEIVIQNGARVEAGVVALGRDSTNTIHIEDGSLRAVLIEGGNEVLDRIRDKRGLASNKLPTQKETILLGKEGGFNERRKLIVGELIVGGIVDVEAIHQLGGTWSYAVNASSDDFGVFPDTTAAGTIKVKTTDLNHDLKGTTSVSRATFQRIDGESNDLSIEVDSNAFLGVIDGIHGAKTSLTTKGEVSLSGESSYGGDTIIQDGGILYAENNSALSEKSSVVIEKDGLLDLQGFDNTINSLSGSGDLVLNPRTSTIQNSDDEVKGADLVIKAGDFAGTIDDGSLSGLGSVTKISDADLTLSGVNTYSSPTFVEGGTLIAASSTALSPNSDFVLSNNGVLDLSIYPRQARFKAEDDNGYSAYLKSLTVNDESQLRVSSLAPLRVKEKLEFDQGEIAAFLDSGANSTAPIQIDEAGKFVFRKGRKLGPASLYMVVSNEEARQQEGTWNVIDGEVENADELAKNTYLLIPALPSEKNRENQADFVEIDGVDYRIAQFDGVDQPLADAALSDVRLEEGSLKLVVEQKSFAEIQEDLNGDDGDVDELPGCEDDDELCDVISDIDGEEDEASNVEEDSAVEIIEAVMDGLKDQEIEISFGFDYGQLAKLVTSGLAPRNVDAAGRGMALFNNQLVDSVFDRQPMRQFEELIHESSVSRLDADLSSDIAAVESDSVEDLSSDIGIVEMDGVAYVDRDE